MEWRNVWTRGYSVQYAEVIMTAMGESGPSKASILRRHMLFPENRNVGCYLPKDEHDALKGVINALISDPESLEREIAAFDRQGEEYVALAKEIAENDMAGLDERELLMLYDSFREKWTEYTSYLWTMFITSEMVAEKAEQILEDHDGVFPSNERYEEFARYLASPSDKASAMKLNAELRGLKAAFDEERLKDICERYRWIPCLDIHYPPWNVSDIVELYEQDHPTEHAVDRSILEEAELTPEERGLIELNRRMAYYRDKRDEYRRIGIYYAQALYREIGKRMGLDLKGMAFASAAEIRDFLLAGKKPDQGLMEDRADGFLMFGENGGMRCVIGKEIESHLPRLGFSKKDAAKQEIIGRCASKGIVKGTARVVLEDADLRKVSEGDVLVALTTGPSYVPAMAKAAAFVTDQGGITCHAAIISREMRKPCIVGTQNATSLIKDGDLVEVDADNGIVRKLT